jgi:hypothetical protein
VRSTSIVAPSKLGTLPEQMRTPPYEPSALSVGHELVNDGGRLAAARAEPAGSIAPAIPSSNSKDPRLMV